MLGEARVQPPQAATPLLEARVIRRWYYEVVIGDVLVGDQSLNQPCLVVLELLTQYPPALLYSRSLPKKITEGLLPHSTPTSYTVLTPPHLQYLASQLSSIAYVYLLARRE